MINILIEKLKTLRLYFAMCRFRLLTIYHLYKAYKQIEGNIYKYNYRMDMVYFYDELFEYNKTKLK